MTRKTNLSTIRSLNQWGNSWSSDVSYTSLVLLDNRVVEYLTGLFYSLKMPSSYYVISRFHSDFTLIEVDLLIFNFSRLKRFVFVHRFFYLVIVRFRRWLRRFVFNRRLASRISSRITSRISSRIRFKKKMLGRTRYKKHKRIRFKKKNRRSRYKNKTYRKSMKRNLRSRYITGRRTWRRTGRKSLYRIASRRIYRIFSRRNLFRTRGRKKFQNKFRLVVKSHLDKFVIGVRGLFNRLGLGHSIVSQIEIRRWLHHTVVSYLYSSRPAIRARARKRKRLLLRAQRKLTFYSALFSKGICLHSRTQYQEILQLRSNVCRNIRRSVSYGYYCRKFEHHRSFGSLSVSSKQARCYSTIVTYIKRFYKRTLYGLTRYLGLNVETQKLRLFSVFRITIKGLYSSEDDDTKSNLRLRYKGRNPFTDAFYATMVGKYMFDLFSKYRVAVDTSCPKLKRYLAFSRFLYGKGGMLLNKSERSNNEFWRKRDALDLEIAWHAADYKEKEFKPLDIGISGGNTKVDSIDSGYHSALYSKFFLLSNFRHGTRTENFRVYYESDISRLFRIGAWMHDATTRLSAWFSDFCKRKYAQMRRSYLWYSVNYHYAFDLFITLCILFSFFIAFIPTVYGVGIIKYLPLSSSLFYYLPDKVIVFFPLFICLLFLAVVFTFNFPNRDKIFGPYTSDTKFSDTNTSDTKSSGTQPSDAKSSDTKSASTNASGDNSSGTANTSVSGTNTSDTKSSATNSAGTAVSDAKTSDTNTSDTKSSATNSAGTAASDGKVSDAKTSDTNTSDTKSSATYSAGTAASDGKVSGAKTSDTNTSDTKSSATNSAGTTASGGKVSDTSASDIKTANTNASVNKASDTKSSNTNSSEANSSDTNSASTNASDDNAISTKSAETNASSSKVSETKTSDTKSSATNSAGTTASGGKVSGTNTSNTKSSAANSAGTTASGGKVSGTNTSNTKSSAANSAGTTASGGKVAGTKSSGVKVSDSKASGGKVPDTKTSNTNSSSTQSSDTNSASTDSSEPVFIPSEHKYVYFKSGSPCSDTAFILPVTTTRFIYTLCFIICVFTWPEKACIWLDDFFTILSSMLPTVVVDNAAVADNKLALQFSLPETFAENAAVVNNDMINFSRSLTEVPSRVVPSIWEEPYYVPGFLLDFVICNMGLWMVSVFIYGICLRIFVYEIGVCQPRAYNAQHHNLPPEYADIYYRAILRPRSFDEARKQNLSDIQYLLEVTLIVFLPFFFFDLLLPEVDMDAGLADRDGEYGEIWGPVALIFALHIKPWIQFIFVLWCINTIIDYLFTSLVESEPRTKEEIYAAWAYITDQRSRVKKVLMKFWHYFKLFLFFFFLTCFVIFVIYCFIQLWFYIPLEMVYESALFLTECNHI